MCNNGITRDNSPHFIVKVTANGCWCKSLVDTGATISFVSNKYLFQNNIKTTKSTEPTTVRLGNGHIHQCTEHVNLDMTVEGKSCNIKCIVMPLPPGIDSILGMDWCNENNVWLNPKSHRIIFSDDIDIAKCTFIEPFHVLNTEIPIASVTNIKEQRGVVHTCNMANIDCDTQFVSSNCLRKMLQLTKTGDMSMDMCNLISKPVIKRVEEVDNDGNPALDSIDLNFCSKVTKKPYKKKNRNNTHKNKSTVQKIHRFTRILIQKLRKAQIKYIQVKQIIRVNYFKNVLVRN